MAFLCKISILLYVFFVPTESSGRVLGALTVRRILNHELRVTVLAYRQPSVKPLSYHLVDPQCVMDPVREKRPMR